MLSLKQFISKYNGKSVDVPWGFKGECVSLVQRYVNESFGVPLQSRGHGMNWEVNMVRAGFGKKVNSPKEGDLVVWGKEVAGGYGHVAIYLDSKNIFDQNRTENGKKNRTAKKRATLSTKPVAFIRMNPIKASSNNKLTFDEVVAKTRKGDYGNLPGRRKKVEAEGYDFDKVQSVINNKDATTSNKKVKVGDKVHTKATHNSDGVKLDGRSVHDTRDFTVQQLSKDGKQVLLKEVRTWVYISTLTGQPKPSKPSKPSNDIGKYANMTGFTWLFAQARTDNTYPKGTINNLTNLQGRSAEILDDDNGRVKVSVPSFDVQTIWVAKSQITISKRPQFKIH